MCGCAGVLRGIPEGNIEVEPGDARSMWFDRGGDDVAIEEEPGFGDTQSLIEKLRRVEQVPQQGEGFGGDEFAADALARKFSALEKEHAGACTGGGDGGGGSGRAAADYGEVEVGARGGDRRQRVIAS